ncbi:MAG: phospholipase D-like domain-containing protein [Candidatus ainarchaeum sp.]|nr:phospholipase D-like domain-containing protein [Candidatus ainarchaeum sp.]
MNFFTKKEAIFFITILIISFLIIFFFTNYNSSFLSFEKGYLSTNTYVSDLEIFFCPEDYCSSHLISEINFAEKSIYVAIYSFTHYDIANALISAKKRGLDVKIIIDFLQSTSKYSLHNMLEEQGILIFIKKDSGVMHNKFAIIDEKKVFTGSFNYSLNADTKNDETLILIKNKIIASKFFSKFNKLLKESY